MRVHELFGPKATGHTLDAFHGTGADIHAFRLDMNRKGAGSRESPIGLWFTDNPEAASQFADFAARGSGANVIPVKLRLQNPWEVLHYDEIRDLVDRFTTFKRPGYELGGRQIRMVDDKVDYEAARNWLRSQGHDGIILRGTITDSPDGTTPINQYIVLDPSQVRSRFANFDPAKKDSEIITDSEEPVRDVDLWENAPLRLGPSITDVVRAEAAGQGFDTNTIWYHGTNRRFKAFRERGNHGELGHGIYLTRSQRAANSWAGMGNHVLACFLKPKPIFDLTKRHDPAVKKDIHARHTRLLKATWGERSDGYDDAMFAEWYDNLWQRGDPNETLRKLGFMGAVDHTSQIENQIVIFDPADIFIAARMPGW